MESITIKIKGEIVTVNKGIKAKDVLSKVEYIYPVMGVLVDNQLEDLNYTFNKNCVVEFVDMTSLLGVKIYERTLLLVLILAARKVLPEEKLSIEHSLGGGIYCELYDKKITKLELDEIRLVIKDIIHMDLSIEKSYYNCKEAVETIDQEQIDLLKYIPEDRRYLYTLGSINEYFNGYLLPSTGYLNLFELRYYYPGFVLLYPPSRDPLKLPVFRDQKKLFNVFSKYEKWCNYFNIVDVASLNEKVINNDISQLIRVAESNHERQINMMAEEIYQNREHIRIILISGPSSAGKTTTSKRLKTSLMVHGIMPITIELDNYFVDRHLTPRDENGDYDFENIDAVDIELFNEHLLKLMNYEEVEIPKFNFLLGKREKGKIIKIEDNHPIIIEGIHGLNEKLTKYIPKDNKYKIYINALTHLNINSYNRIPTTDIRLIRRMVRDYKYRGHSGEATIKMWGSVRKGEEKYIFPYQEEADFIFNSALFYELSVLKKYAMPILNEIDSHNKYHPYARRIMDFLELFHPIEDESSILGNSILREFIGGSTL